jgi:uncharacterized protein (TIGR00369 family)
MPPRPPAALKRLFASSRFAREHGFRLAGLGRGRASVRTRVARDSIQGLGLAQGGILTALADTAATFAGYSAVDAVDQLLTLELSMSFLAPAGEGQGLEARGRLLRCGRRIVVADAQVHDASGRRIAAGRFTMIRLPGREPPPARGPVRSRASRSRSSP